MWHDIIVSIMISIFNPTVDIHGKQTLIANYLIAYYVRINPVCCIGAKAVMTRLENTFSSNWELCNIDDLDSSLLFFSNLSIFESCIWFNMVLSFARMTAHRIDECTHMTVWTEYYVIDNSILSSQISKRYWNYYMVIMEQGHNHHLWSKDTIIMATFSLSSLIILFCFVKFWIVLLYCVILFYIACNWYIMMSL